jgi:hypothetical protein
MIYQVSGELLKVGKIVAISVWGRLPLPSRVSLVDLVFDVFAACSQRVSSVRFMFFVDDDEM